MKKHILIFAASIITAVFAGCTSSVETASNLYDENLTATPGRTIGHAHASISGTYILFFIPIACGDPEKPGNTLWFQDKVSIDNALDMLTKNSISNGASKTYNIQTNTYASVWEYSLFLLWVKHAEASGNIIK